MLKAIRQNGASSSHTVDKWRT